MGHDGTNWELGFRQCSFHHAFQVLRVCNLVVFQKWRWTEINVTLGLIFVALLRKEWPMTFIAVRCPHCQSDQIVKRGKTARGTQRYLCQNTRCRTVKKLMQPRACSISGVRRAAHDTGLTL